MTSLLRGLIGGGGQTSEPTGVETVEKLCDRVTTASLPDDRRGALRGLKAMARNFKLEVGTRSLEILIDIIKQDRSDQELLEYALETLQILFEASSRESGPDDLGVQFSEIFLKSADNINLLLACLEEFEFKIRMATVRSLTCLLENKCETVQTMILESPMGISRLMDILADSREIIRNDGLLLLMHLTKDNAQIQKIVAFENAFDRLISIIDNEGNSDGGIVVKDCLMIMHTMLHGNNSNQALFREASLLQRLVSILDLDLSEQNTAWKTEKVDNVVLTLKVIRLLVHPNNPQQNTLACQKVMQQSGILSRLFKMTFSMGIPTEVLEECINTVAEGIRGNVDNQAKFDQLKTPSEPPRSASLAMLLSMLSDKQPQGLRLAAVYCFQCYLHKNPELQAKVIETLLPSTEEVPDITAGQILCTGLFGNDPMGHWCSAVALAKCLNGDLQKELLRVQLSMKDQGQVTLLQQISTIMIRPQLDLVSRLGLLILVITWLQNCHLAVSQFLSIQDIIPYLTGQTESEKHNEGDTIIRGLCASLLGVCLAYHDGSNTQYTKDTLRQILVHRIGEDSFKDALTAVATNENFSRASRNPQVQPSKSGQLFFDHSFTQVFTQVKDVILKAMDPSQPDTVQTTPAKSASSTAIEEHHSIVTSYKELIRDQDSELTVMKGKYQKLEQEMKEKDTQLYQMMSEMQILRDQLKLSLGKTSQEDTDGRSVVVELQKTVQELHAQLEDQRKRMQTKDLEFAKVQEELILTKTDLKQNGSVDRNEDLILSLKAQVSELQDEKEALLTEKAELDHMLMQMNNSKPTPAEPDLNSQIKISQLETELNKVTEAFKEMRSKTGIVEKEQEDLLVLLADNDARVKRYKALLVENNIPIPESEDEESGDEDEDEDDEDSL